jgi:hypothetical protein
VSSRDYNYDKHPQKKHITEGCIAEASAAIGHAWPSHRGHQCHQCHWTYTWIFHNPALRSFSSRPHPTGGILSSRQFPTVVPPAGHLTTPKPPATNPHATEFKLTIKRNPSRTSTTATIPTSYATSPNWERRLEAAVSLSYSPKQPDVPACSDPNCVPSKRS